MSRTNNIYPACLPSNNHLNTATLHSGWSKPPPLNFVEAVGVGYAEVIGEFSKQWHYLMKITKCEDPKTYTDQENWGPIYTLNTLNYPANSYYPPGTVCAVEKERKFCPTSGESGSPLMVTNDEGRMVAEGIFSFIKVLITIAGTPSANLSGCFQMCTGGV